MVEIEVVEIEVEYSKCHRHDIKKQQFKIQKSEIRNQKV